MSDEFNPLKHLHLGDRGTIPLAAGGHAPAEIIAYRGVGEERRLYCRLTESPDTVVPVRPEAFRRIAMIVGCAAILAGCGWSMPAPEDRLRVIVRDYWYAQPGEALR